MSNVLIISDMHLSPRIPISRKDNYPETIITKLHNTLQLAKDYKVTDIIYLGDLFNTKHMTLSYFIKCFQQFKEINDANIKQHLIIGNHDILYNNDDTIQQSPIQLLLDSKMFDNQGFLIDDCLFHLYNYTHTTDNIPSVDNKKLYNILIGHYFYAIGFNDNLHTLTKEQCLSLGYNSYILGHDHTPYDPIINKNYQVHRPGSFSRGTSQTCQVNRNSIQVLLFNTSTHSYTYLNVPNVLPSSDIYKESHLIEKVSLSSISESLQDFLSALNFNNSSDIYQTLDSIPMSQEIKDLLTSYLNAEGVYRQEVTNDTRT